MHILLLFFFFLNDTATTEIYTLSLHDALPILLGGLFPGPGVTSPPSLVPGLWTGASSSGGDRKSTRLNSSHANISYAVFCLKKKNNPYDLRQKRAVAAQLESEIARRGAGAREC